MLVPSRVLAGMLRPRLRGSIAVFAIVGRTIAKSGFGVDCTLRWLRGGRLLVPGSSVCHVDTSGDLPEAVAWRVPGRGSAVSAAFALRGAGLAFTANVHDCEENLQKDECVGVRVRTPRHP